MRPPGTKVSVILPTFNEKENIVTLVRELQKHIARPLEIIVVDDGSPDGTADLVAGLSDPGVVLVRRKTRGLAGAFNRGIMESSGEIICWMDADMGMPPPVLQQMIDTLDRYDIAIGSRYAEGGRDLRSPIRVRASRLINAFANSVLGGGIRDYDSGFVALRREVFDSISIIPYGYGEYFIEMVYDAFRAGLRIVEVGYDFKDRTAGYSKSMPSLFAFLRTGTHYAFRILSLRLRFLRGGR